MCHKLEEINELPEGLKIFLCINCRILTRLPERLPKSMEIFYCGSSEYVSELPILNDGLKKNRLFKNTNRKIANPSINAN